MCIGVLGGGGAVDNQRSKQGQARMVSELKQIEFVGKVWGQEHEYNCELLNRIIEKGRVSMICPGWDVGSSMTVGWSNCRGLRRRVAAEDPSLACHYALRYGSAKVLVSYISYTYMQVRQQNNYFPIIIR